MSQNNWTKSSSKPVLEVVSQKQPIKVVMPLSVMDKIKFLCMNIPKEEWSGVLFYTIKGSIKDPSKMIIKLKDILPLDKGTKAYTEYELDERFEDYLMENPMRMTYHIGHIHSHNDMGVFFSGTDMSELNDNSEAHNFYLSLIVNNWMEFKAKVATRATAKTETFMVPYKALDEDGEEYVVEEKAFHVNRTVMMVYDCEVDAPKVETKVTKSFISKVADLFKKEERAKAKAEEEKKLAEAMKKLEEMKKLPPAKKNEPKKEELNGFMVAADMFVRTYCDDLFEGYTDTELFLMGLFNFTNDPKQGDTLESILDMLEEYDMNGVEVAKCVLEVYVPLYAKFFPDRDEKDFKNDTEEVIEMLEEQVTIYPLINQTIDGLKVMVEKFKEYANTNTVQ